MTGEFTRRELAALVAALPAAAAVPQQKGAEPDPGEAARQRLRESIAKLEAFALPMAVEPAFVFRP
jgi:hypothetical protein